MQPNYWKKAQAHLSNDPVLREVIASYKGESLRSRGTAFETLLRSIVGQQISVKAAASVWTRVMTLIEKAEPETLLKFSSQDLRSCGLSERKVSYCQDLARHFVSGEVNSHRWPKMLDDEIIAELVKVRGIGRWTAEMFLIFHLLRPDVFPVDDLGLQKAIAKLYRKRYPMSPRTLNTVAKKWAPYRSVATWYLWRSLDPIPVEY